MVPVEEESRLAEERLLQLSEEDVSSSSGRWSRLTFFMASTMSWMYGNWGVGPAISPSNSKEGWMVGRKKEKKKGRKDTRVL